MANRDRYHFAVKRGLEKQSWIITADPLVLEIDEALVKIDLAAERLIGAERDGNKIAVEIKSFIGDSAMSEFHTALGQCLDYQIMLEENEPERGLYLAVPADVYDTFFQTRFARMVLERYPLKLIVYDPVSEEILQWIP
jgi:XisH protein